MAVFKKLKKGAKKATLGGAKAMVKGGKVGTAVGKGMKMVGAPQADRVLASARASKASGRVIRQGVRGKQVKRKAVGKAVKNTARMGMTYA